jgi:hypothetical protein
MKDGWCPARPYYSNSLPLPLDIVGVGVGAECGLLPEGEYRTSERMIVMLVAVGPYYSKGLVVHLDGKERCIGLDYRGKGSVVLESWAPV